MRDFTKIIGLRIRTYRNDRELTQEELAEKCCLHPTYIGQVERGEKNASILSVEKIAMGLDIPIEYLFKNIVETAEYDSNAEKILNVISSLDKKEQKKMLQIMETILDFKNAK